MKFITKGRLIAAMERGNAEGYNHQIDPDTINSLDPAHHYHVLTAIPHEHKDGALSELHMRLLVGIKTRTGETEKILIDVPCEVYEDLQEIQNKT